MHDYLSKFSSQLSASNAACVHRAIVHSYLGQANYDANEFLQDMVKAAAYGISMQQPGWATILTIAQKNLQKTVGLLSGNDDVDLPKENLLNKLVNEILASNFKFEWKMDPDNQAILRGTSANCNCVLNLSSGEIALDNGVVVDLLASDENKYMRSVLGKPKLMVTITNNIAISADDEFRFEVKKYDNYYHISESFKKIMMKDSPDSDGIVLYLTLGGGWRDKLDTHDCTALRELLGHAEVNIWKIGEHLSFRYEDEWGHQLEYYDAPVKLLIDKRNPNIAVYKNDSTYVLMNLVDGVWLKSSKQLMFSENGGQADMDTLLKRAAPIVEHYDTSERNQRPSTFDADNGFLYEEGQCKRIIIPSINISFTINEGVWMCDQHPDYKLMNQKSVPMLDTYSYVFVLQHIHTKITRVLLTPFDWEGPKPDRNIDNKPIVNRSNRYLLADHPLICDVENNDLVSDNPATHLYLAIIFRAQRNYELAMYHLNKSYHAGESSEIENKITDMLNRFPLHTSRAAAFDIHFLLRARHHIEKFIHPTFKDRKEFDLLLSEAVQKYRNSESHFRTGVNGIPESLQVPQWVLDAVPVNISLQTHIPQSSLLNDLEEYTAIENKVKKNDEDPWDDIRCRYHHTTMEWFDNFSKANKNKATSHRVDCGDATQKLTLTELYQDFLCLAKYAVKGTEAQKARVRSYILTFLSQNNATYNGHYKPILVVLLFMLNNVAAFSRIVNSDDPKRCLVDSINIIAGLDSTDIAFGRTLEKINLIKPCHLLPAMALPEYPIQARITKAPLIAPAASPGWTPPLVEESIWKRWPAVTLYEQYFKEERIKPYANSQSPFQSWTSKDALENNMIRSMQTAFENLKKSERSLHHANTDFNAVNLAHEVSNQAEEFESKMYKKESQLIALLNHTDPSIESEFHALQAAEQPGKLGLQHVVEAMLSRSHEPLLKRNPTLTTADLSKIYSMMIEHQSLKIEYNQMQEAQKISGSQQQLNAVDLQRLGEVLFRKRLYDPGKYPEILVYASATGRDPNPSQLKILQQLFSMLEGAIDLKKIEHLLLEFAAGGGKTSVLIPILAMFLTSRGKLPVISNTSSLYYQSLQELPPMLRAAFGQQLELIDRDVEHEWTLAELRALKTKLHRWHTHEGCALLIKASSWQSLNSAKKIACYQAVVNNDQNAKEREKLILDILGYFKEHAVLLEDECHISSDPHQETIRAFEIGKPVPMQHHEIYFKAYLAANKAHKSGTAISDVDRNNITQACIAVFLKYQPFKGLNWLQDYLSSPLDTPRPKQLLALNKSDPDKADLVILAKACIHHHLPFTGTFTLGKEYGDSIHEGDMTAAPRHDGRPSGAHYMDTMLISALTIQKTLEGGIPVRDLPTLVKGLREIYDSSLLKGERVTKLEKKLRNALGDDTFRMDEVSNEELVKRLENTKCLHDPYLAKQYLMGHALKQIHFQGRSAKSTPAEMAQGFNISIQLSATPGLVEIYSVLLRNDNLLDTEFAAEVLTVLMERNASGLIVQDRSTPAAFIEEIAKKCPEDFERLRAFMDKGGIFANFSPDVLAQAFVDVASKHDLLRGAITWHNEQTIKVESPTEGRVPDKKDVISTFTLQQTTGRDNPDMDFQARGAMTLGKKVGTDDVVQGAMRERKLLIPGAQTLFWCVMEDLWQTIVPDVKGFDVNKAVRWTLENQAETFRSKVLMRAYQGIDAELHAIAWNLISKGDLRGKKMLDVLCAEPRVRPWDIYAKDFHLEKTAKVLNEYRDSLIKRLELRNNEVTSEISARINKIATQTANLLEVISTTSSDSLLQIGFKEEEKEEEKELELQVKSTQRQDSSAYQKLAAERYDADDRLEKRTNAIKLFFTKNPNALDGQFNTFAVKGIAPNKLPMFGLPLADRLTPCLDWKGVIKPMSHILMKKLDDGSWSYYALTEAGARFYAKNIHFLNEQKDTNIQAFLMTIGGSVLAETLNVKSEERDAQINGSRCRQIISLLEMMVSRKFDANEMIATLHELNWSRDDYKAFCQYVRDISPPDEEIMPEKYEDDFTKILGWGKAKPATLDQGEFKRRPRLVVEDEQVKQDHKNGIDIRLQ